MKKSWPLLAFALIVLGGTSAMGANHVVVESKSVAPGATGVTVGIYVENDVELSGVVLPIEFRELTTTGAFIADTLAIDAANRMTTSLIGFVIINTYPDPDNVNPGQCNGGGYATIGPPDFVSPDGLFFSGLSVLDPCLPIGNDGAPPGGTPSLVLTFDVSNNDGLFVIDTTCSTPGNHLTYVNCAGGSPVVPTFAAGQITVGNPIFPPEVGDIPGETINEGGVFAQINLNDYVDDLDNLDSEISWNATGQTDLIVSISGGNIATIQTPDADYFGTETITFTATDPDLQFDSDSATFEVLPVNDPPVLDAIFNKTVQSGKPLSFPVTGSDVDNDSLTLTIETPPVGSTFNSDGVGNGQFMWSTACDDVGVYNVSFVLSDGELADTVAITITVLDNPDTLVADVDSVYFEYEYEGTPPASQNIHVTDPGCGQLPWEVMSTETWLVVSPDTGTTPGTIQLNIDTTGLPPGEFDASVIISERTAIKLDPIVITIPVHLSIPTELCECPCHGDGDMCNGVPDVFDMILVVDVAFRNAIPRGHSDCPYFYTDLNCDCVVDVFDAIIMADHAFRSVTGPYCSEDGPCGADTPCATVP